MIIGIDASRAFLKDRTGIEEYSYQVIKHLRKDLENHQVVLYIRSEQESAISEQKFTLPKNWKLKRIKFPYLWTQIGLSLEMLFHPVNVLFIPAHVVPFFHPRNTVVTIHGLEYEFMPEAYSFWERIYMRVSIKMSCRWARKIISVSKNTKNDLRKIYGVPDDKIKVVYEGYNKNSQFPISNSQENQKSKIKNQNDNSKLKISEKYLLFIGRLEKRKNLEGIISAFEILKEKYGIPHKLILVGRPGYGYEEIKEKIQNSRAYRQAGKFKVDIIEKGYVGEEEKAKLLANADVFLFPTFYEGFGLPILEAQSMGVPVVTSNVSSLPEVAGEGALYADPNEPSLIAETIQKIIADGDLREKLIKKGRENLERFSWKKCAKEIAEILVGK